MRPAWFTSLLRIAAVIGGFLALVNTLAGLTTELPTAAPKWLQWLSALAEALSIPWLGPAAYWATLVVCTGICALALGLRWTDRGRIGLAAATPAAPSPAGPPQQGSIDALNALKLVFGSFAPAFWEAISYLRDLCDAGLQSVNGDRQIAGSLVNSQIVNPADADHQALGRQIADTKRAWTIETQRELVASFRSAAVQYASVLGWLMRFGSISDPGLYAAERYKTVYDLHLKVKQAADLVVHRDDIRPAIIAITQISNLVAPADPPPLLRLQFLPVHAAGLGSVRITSELRNGITVTAVAYVLLCVEIVNDSAHEIEVLSFLCGAQRQGNGEWIPPIGPLTQALLPDETHRVIPVGRAKRFKFVQAGEYHEPIDKSGKYGFALILSAVGVPEMTVDLPLNLWSVDGPGES
jgi:hypothetical protein